MWVLLALTASSGGPRHHNFAAVFATFGAEADDQLPDHPEVARDANNIGQILQAQGDLAGALKHAQRALRVFEKVFGPDHPQTRIAAGNIRGIQEAMQ
ncbi:MAG: tetratricopeptide repeat protein [Bryobacterales bacterium]